MCFAILAWLVLLYLFSCKPGWFACLLVLLLDRDARGSDQDASRHRDHAIAHQRERVRFAAERDHRGVAAEVPDHVSEDGPVERL